MLLPPHLTHTPLFDYYTAAVRSLNYYISALIKLRANGM